MRVSGHRLDPGPMLRFIKNIFFDQKIGGKKLSFCTRNKARLCKIWS
jgi:hypothetical protein